MKNERQQKILQIIKGQSIDTQEQLTKILKDMGFKVTQATVSRDIKDLRLIKVLSDDGLYKYFYPSKNERYSTSNQILKFSAILNEGVVSVENAMNLVVIKCLSGMANAVCAAIDGAENKTIVGTLAGDDTIFIAMKNEENAHTLVNDLNNLLASGPK